MNLNDLEASVRQPEPQALNDAVTSAIAGDAQAQRQVCGALLWSVFTAPLAITKVFDVISGACLQGIHESDDVPAKAVFDVPTVALTAEFWQAFERTLLGPEEGYDATSITVAVASLGASLDPEFGQLAETAAQQHPGAQGASDRPIPPMICLDELATLPDNSLGYALYRMLTDNGFDAEVLDREAIGLEKLPPALRYLNTRILQMHDIWHLSAGYQTTSLHEMAISAFQLAQFGHGYSGMFLATVVTMSHLRQPQGFGLMLKNLSEAWLHGRQSPSFMAINWEQEWHQDIAAIRSKYGIEPFAGSFPADLLEQLAAA